MDAGTNPLVSVIIPTCNRPESLALALDSLCWQTFKDFEAVIVDDGQVDARPVIEKYSGKLRLSYHENPRNMGVAATRNAGMRAASGRYIAYLDDDDLYYENHLDFLTTMLREGGVSVAYSDGNQALMRKIDGRWTTVNRRINFSYDFDAQKLLRGNYIPTLCIMHDRRCLEVAGYFKTHLGAHEDWDLWLRMSRFYTFGHVPHPTCEYMVRAGGDSLSGNEEGMKETWFHVRKLAGFLERLPRVEELAANMRGTEVLKRAANPKCRLSVLLYADKAGLPGLRACLAALNKAWPEDAELVLILDEPDELADKLAASPKGDLTVIRRARPVGRVLALNQALQYARGETLLFISPALRPRPGGLEDMLDRLREAGGRAIVTVPLQSGSGQVYCGGGLREDGRVNALPALEQGDASPGPDCASLHCLMLGKDLFAGLGGFATRFAPAFYEDADLCLRARRDFNIPVITLETAAFIFEDNKALSTPELVRQKAMTSYNAANFAAQWGKSPDLSVPECGDWL